MDACGSYAVPASTPGTAVNRDKTLVAQLCRQLVTNTSRNRCHLSALGPVIGVNRTCVVCVKRQCPFRTARMTARAAKIAAAAVDAFAAARRLLLGGTGCWVIGRGVVRRRGAARWSS